MPSCLVQKYFSKSVLGFERKPEALCGFENMSTQTHPNKEQEGILQKSPRGKRGL